MLSWLYVCAVPQPLHISSPLPYFFHRHLIEHAFHYGHSVHICTSEHKPSAPLCPTLGQPEPGASAALW